MTEKQKDLIDDMNEFCREKFEYTHGGEKVIDTRKAEGQRVDAGAVPATSTRPVKARMRRSLLRGLLSRRRGPVGSTAAARAKS